MTGVDSGAGTIPAQDEFGSHMPYYQRGRAWASAVLDALDASDIEAVTAGIAEADRLLGPLGGVSDPNLLRDFIAGLAREMDDTLLDPA